MAKSSHDRGCRHICLPHRYRTSKAIPGYPAPRMAPSPFGVHALRHGKANACGHNLTMHLSPESYLTTVPIQGLTKLTQPVRRKSCSASRRGLTMYVGIMQVGWICDNEECMSCMRALRQRQPSSSKTDYCASQRLPRTVAFALAYGRLGVYSILACILNFWCRPL